MIPFIVYLSNGKIIRGGTCQKETIDNQAGDNEFVIESDADVNKHWIVDGAVQSLPLKPGDDYEFDYGSGQWIPNVHRIELQARFKRDRLLKDGPDRINPIWWASMSATDQAAVTEYRQALLDITQQLGYPMEITWPDLPEVFR